MSDLKTPNALAILKKSSGANGIGYIHGASNTVETTLDDKEKERVSVLDFMTKTQRSDVLSGTASVDVTSALLNAIASGEALVLPNGGYLIDGELDTFTGDDIVFVGESLERCFIQATDNVVGAILDINKGGVSRYSRGLIGNFKLLGAKLGNNPNWHDDTYYASHGIRVNNVVNGLKIKRVRVLRTNTAGVEFEANTWFNSLTDSFFENIKGDGWAVKSNSNGVNITGTRSYLCERGWTVEDSFAVGLFNTSAEDTKGYGGRILSSVGVSLDGACWFEDHGMVTTTDGGLYIRGVVADTTRPSVVSLDAAFFNSSGDHAMKLENAHVTAKNIVAQGTTVKGVILDNDSIFEDSLTNDWNVSGAEISGAGYPAKVVNHDALWIPVISDAVSGGNTASYTANATSQKYFKRGNQVTVQGRLENIDTTGMTASNLLFIQGLPIAASSTDYSTGDCQVSEVTITGAYLVPTLQGSGVNTVSYFTNINSAATRVSLKVSDITAATADIFFSLTYNI